MKKLRKYIIDRFKNLSKHLKSYEVSLESVRLHDIRLEIKRIKAIINLAGEYNKGFHSHKEFKSIRGIFREAGDIRQPEILFQLLLEYGVKNVEKDPLLDKDHTMIDDFIDYIPLYIKSCKKAREKLINVTRKISRIDVRGSMKKAKKRIEKSLTHKINFESIHKIRKHIKQVLYLSEISKDLRKKEKSFFNGLQELIGSVHDKQTLIILLRKSSDLDHKMAIGELQKSIDIDAQKIVKYCEKFYNSQNTIIA